MDDTEQGFERSESPLALIRQSYQRETPEEEAARTGVGLTEVKHARFAALIANGSAVPEAAVEMRISVATAYRWLKEKEVASAIKKTQQQVTAAGQRKLQRLQHEAIETLAELMRNSDQDKVKAQVAFGIIDRTGLSVQQLLADAGVQAAPVVIQEFLQINHNAAEMQQKRALVHDPHVDGPIDASFTVAEPEEEELYPVGHQRTRLNLDFTD